MLHFLRDYRGGTYFNVDAPRCDTYWRRLVEAQRLLEKKQYCRKKKTGGRGREYGIFRNQEKEKIMYNFRVSAFRSYLTFLRSVKQLGGVASGEAFLCLELPGIKAKDLQIQRGSKKYVLKSLYPVFFLE